MGKYGRLIKRAVGSADYWAQAAMRRFVLDIDKRMLAQDISRAELAEKLGTSRAYVTKAMRGDVNFTLETMTKLALAVGGKLHIEVVDRDVSTPKVGLQWHVERRDVAAASALPAQNQILRLDPRDLPANEPEWPQLEQAA
jgi:transcriptional regulator with XRE-family HTH domain